MLPIYGPEDHKPSRTTAICACNPHL